MGWLADPEAWAALAALTTLEIVLGADNLVFLAVLASRLPPERQAAARRLGLAVALLTRLLLLASIVWLAKLTAPLFAVMGHAFSGRDLILAAGGLYLVYSGTREIHAHIEEGEAAHGEPVLDHGRRDHHCRGGDALARNAGLGVYWPASDGQDAGVQLPLAHRHHLGRRWFRLPRAARLYLCGDRFLDRCRDPQSARGAPPARGATPYCAVCASTASRLKAAAISARV